MHGDTFAIFRAMRDATNMLQSCGKSHLTSSQSPSPCIHAITAILRSLRLLLAFIAPRPHPGHIQGAPPPQNSLRTNCKSLSLSLWVTPDLEKFLVLYCWLFSDEIHYYWLAFQRVDVLCMMMTAGCCVTDTDVAVSEKVIV